MMKNYYYDLHIHSCLSPCGDNDNTPNNIIGMASLCGLDIAALCDHNSVANCPAFFKAAKRYGVVPVAGMELTTSEDIHIICLFETLEGAMEFGKEVDNLKIPVKNRPDIFGCQQILDGDDNIIGEEENLLINATMISVEELPNMVAKYGGICYPAHIDRSSNSIISVLGTFPETPHFDCVEFHDKQKCDEYIAKYSLQHKKIIISSDAHYLTQLRDKENYFSLPDGLSGDEQIRSALFDFLRR